MELVINILHVIVCIAIIAVVLLQSGRSAGISGAISGGAETFFGKNKGRTIDAMLSNRSSSNAVSCNSNYISTLIKIKRYALIVRLYMLLCVWSFCLKNSLYMLNLYNLNQKIDW
jgi:preprotein translocase subunit SecG